MSAAPTIRRLESADLPGVLDGLIALLIDTVEHDASVGFVLPLTPVEAAKYWQGLLPALASGARLLWVCERNGETVGTVQLELATKMNGVNRAEVQKLLVHSGARRLGVGRMLMDAVEQQALRFERGLLYLDTEAGSGAEQFYRALGYIYVGGIPEYACSPKHEWRANAIYYKTLFQRSAK